MKSAHRRLLIRLGMLSLGTALISLALGDYYVSPHQVLAALFGHGLAEDILVVQQLRMPRIAIAFLSGVSLGVSGAILQAVVRNPLAAPDLIGITGGASLAAVAFVVYVPDSVSIQWLPAAAMVGAVVASALNYAIAWKGGVTPFRLILIGIGIASLMSALTTFMVIMSPMHTATEAYIWLTGTVYGSTWEHVVALLPWTVVLLILALYYRRAMNVLQLGDDIARGVGSPVQRHRLSLVAISVLLAGSAVAMCGVIGFIGLIAPHMARRWAGPGGGIVLPASALIGGILVVVSDLVARTAFLPMDIPVGVFTSGVGAPFFIYLLYRTRNAR